nr:AbiEi antitoxin N-terminal domain-containing protein [Burkholderia pyrrocinia]
MSNKTVQRLLRESRRGHPIDSDMLGDMGVSAALAHMVKSGWLQRLSQGVYLLTGDTPSRDGTITVIIRSICKVHRPAILVPSVFRTDMRASLIGSHLKASLRCEPSVPQSVSCEKTRPVRKTAPLRQLALRPIVQASSQSGGQ